MLREKKTQWQIKGQRERLPVICLSFDRFVWNSAEKMSA